MTTAFLPAPAASPPVAAPPWPRTPRWTCDRFHRARMSGALEGMFVHLIHGEMLQMAAPSIRHDKALSKCHHWADAVFTGPFWVRAQMGLFLGINTDPMPDLIVAPGRMEDYAEHPTTALLVVEVAESSLPHDTGDKASLYAAAGIRDYWVVDVDGRRVVVFRDPRPDAAAKYGHAYASVISYAPTDAVAPLAAPGAPAAVADLLP